MPEQTLFTPLHCEVGILANQPTPRDSRRQNAQEQRVNRHRGVAPTQVVYRGWRLRSIAPRRSNASHSRRPGKTPYTASVSVYRPGTGSFFGRNTAVLPSRRRRKVCLLPWFSKTPLSATNNAHPVNDCTANRRRGRRSAAADCSAMTFVSNRLPTLFPAPGATAVSRGRYRREPVLFQPSLASAAIFDAAQGALQHADPRRTLESRCISPFDASAITNQPCRRKCCALVDTCKYPGNLRRAPLVRRDIDTNNSLCGRLARSSLAIRTSENFPLL